VNSQQIPAAKLRILRIALLAGALLFGVVIAVLAATKQSQLNPANTRSFSLIFIVLALVCVGFILWTRRAVERAEPARRGMTVLSGCAFAEGTALFGGVASMFTGVAVTYLAASPCWSRRLCFCPYRTMSERRGAPVCAPTIIASTLVDTRAGGASLHPPAVRPRYL
jgi:hypothetical protein